MQLRAHLIWSGVSLDDLDRMSYDDALRCWELYQKGMAGPSVNYITAFNNYASLHKIGEILQAVHGKNYRVQEPEKFDTVFKEQASILTLKATVERNQLSLGTQAALALEGAPDWLCEAAMEEIRAGNKK